MLSHDDITPLAERSLLGGLMVDGRTFGELQRFVRGTDFADPWHRHVWVAMREAAVAGEPIDALTIGQSLLRRHGGRIADLPRLHQLYADAPAKPDPLPHARHVVDAGLRREIDGQGVLLRAGALEGAMSHEGRRVRAALRICGAAMLIAGERWADANGEPTDGLAERIPSRLRAGAEDLELRRVADKFVAEYPGPERADVIENERRLVASLVHHPTAIGPTADWLRPDQLVNLPWATVYAALTRMAAVGSHIDHTTVALATESLGRVRGAAPELGELISVVDAARGSIPGHLRQAVAGDHLRLAAAAGAAALHRGVESPEVPMVDLLETATTVLQRMDRLSSAFPDRIDVGRSGGRWQLGIDPPQAGPAIEGPAAS